MKPTTALAHERAGARARNPHARNLWRLARKPWLRHALSLAFLGLVGWLLATKIGTVDWPAVGRALRNYDTRSLAAAAVLSLAGYLAAASYDLLGRRYVGHRLPRLRTVAINFIAYAFSLNLGALVGGWAFRVRLYARFALGAGQIARIIAFAVVTNWSGFVLLTGVVFLFWPPGLPPPWPLDEAGERVLGAVLLCVVAGYLGATTIGHRRGWKIRLHRAEFAVPEPRLALWQLLLSSISWLMIASAMDRLMPEEVPFPRMLAVLFAASLIGAATHVPGSLGVLEGSFLVLLGPDLERERVLAALFAFRAVYYLLPLALAAIGYALLELAARREQHACR